MHLLFLLCLSPQARKQSELKADPPKHQNNPPTHTLFIWKSDSDGAGGSRQGRVALGPRNRRQAPEVVTVVRRLPQTGPAAPFAKHSQHFITITATYHGYYY